MLHSSPRLLLSQGPGNLDSETYGSVLDRLALRAEKQLTVPGVEHCLRQRLESHLIEAHFYRRFFARPRWLRPRRGERSGWCCWFEPGSKYPISRLQPRAHLAARPISLMRTERVSKEGHSHFGAHTLNPALNWEAVSQT